MTVCDWDTAIHLVELGLGSTLVPSWYAQAADTRAVAAILIKDLPPVRVGWATRQSQVLFKPAEEFMRMLELDLRSRPSQPGVRWVSRWAGD